MIEESTTEKLDAEELSETEIEFLLAYRSAPAWKKVRIQTLTALMARVMRPDDPDHLCDQIARLFEDAPPAKASSSIMREVWQCINRSRAASNLE